MLKYFKGSNLLDLGNYDSRVPLMAKEKHPQSIVDIIDWIPDIIPFKDESYDYVVMGQLIEHLEEPQKTIKEAFRVLKPKGMLALSTSLEEKGIGEVDDKFHVWSFSQEDIKNLLELYCDDLEIDILRSQHFPYKYHFPHIVAFGRKK